MRSRKAMDNTLDVFADRAQRVLEDNPIYTVLDEPVQIMSPEQIQSLLERSRQEYRSGRVPTPEEITAAKFTARKNR